jgi:hypothetical protein
VFIIKLLQITEYNECRCVYLIFFKKIKEEKAFISIIQVIKNFICINTHTHIYINEKIIETLTHHQENN